MNLSTARASKRAKEVGVRKVIGAGRKDLNKTIFRRIIFIIIDRCFDCIAIIINRASLSQSNNGGKYSLVFSYRLQALVNACVAL